MKLDENNRYFLKTLSTGISGQTNGYWKNNKKHIILFPDGPIYREVDWGDSIEKVEVFRPFDDTLKFRIKGNKLIKKDSVNSIILFKEKIKQNSIYSIDKVSI
ncbi:hypothetical protein [Flavobacterium sp. GCM10023249]|uniref:hypothetical protein n=1 Tax=unclassified Flavobacterium TaxID=196869 RepID=UPI003605B11C